MMNSSFKTGINLKIMRCTYRFFMCTVYQVVRQRIYFLWNLVRKGARKRHEKGRVCIGYLKGGGAKVSWRSRFSEGTFPVVKRKITIFSRYKTKLLMIFFRAVQLLSRGSGKLISIDFEGPRRRGRRAFGGSRSFRGGCTVLKEGKKKKWDLI